MKVKAKEINTDDIKPVVAPWTDDDEKALNLMLKRKEFILKEQYDMVFKLVDSFVTHNMRDYEITEALMENATAIRAVLKPYDKDQS